MLPSVLDVIKEILSPSQAFHTAGVKFGTGLVGAGGVTAVGAPAVLEVLGATLDEWKIYGIAVGIVTAIAGLFVQVFFKWLERRDKQRRYSGPERRR